ncbi:YadA-like family protein, partial [Salmonella enterica]
ATGVVSYITRTLSNLTDGTDTHDAVNKGQLDDVDSKAQGYATTAKNEAITTANNHTNTEISKVLNSGSSTATGGFAIGEKASASGADSTASGQNSVASAIQSTANGHAANAGGRYSTAIGERASATWNYSTAIGQAAQAAARYSTATGAGARSSGESSTATGYGAVATGVSSTATGKAAKATGTNSVALGANSVADQDNQVSIGQKITDAATGVVSYITRTLSNLTDGTDTHDAVNKGQLDDVDSKAQSYADTAKNDAIESAYETTTKAMNRVAVSGRVAGATGMDSYAAGSESKATGTNSVALGANSRATRNNEMNIGTWEFKPAESDKQPAPNRSGEFVRGEYVQTGTRILSGVSDGEKDDEAVNRKQLNDVASTASRAAATAKKEAVRDANKYTDDTARKTLKTANEHTERRAVIAENNAVTRSNAYTDESSSRTLESANTYTNHRAVQAENNAVARSNTYTDNRFGELRKSLQHTEKRLNAGIAGVTAIASIPYVAENSFSYGIGLGNYQNGKALAAGVQYKTSPNTNIRLNVSWDSAGNTATGVGLSGGW